MGRWVNDNDDNDDINNNNNDNNKHMSLRCTVNSLFVAAASITIVCSRIDDDDGKVGVRL